MSRAGTRPARVQSCQEVNEVGGGLTSRYSHASCYSTVAENRSARGRRASRARSVLVCWEFESTATTWTVDVRLPHRSHVFDQRSPGRKGSADRDTAVEYRRGSRRTVRWKSMTR